MRRIVVISAFLICGALHCAAQQPSEASAGKTAVLTFESMSHDFGTLQFKGEPVTHDFAFTNTGDAPLVIIRAEVSCRCLKVAYPKKPVAAGESGVVSVTYTPDKYTGEFYNSIDIFSNATDRRLILLVKGETVK